MPHKRSRAKSHPTISQLSRSCSSRELGGMTKQSRCGESHLELVFHGLTCPRPLTRLELANKFELEHPFFKVVMRPSYFRGKLSIPCEFVKKHIHENKEIATLRYLDRSWPVKIIRSYRHNHAASFCAGWSAFAREPTLCVGDVCVFELIDENDTMFNISIFSSAAHASIR
ncbi:B3 domain-containing transcription factor VRN1-like [Syzygium oleosum]|uniref:B3 domain-containing transcription factor VRN1-like n=1 Tax=Syzygium oleosum TaxID=219896 RepID=UPI0024B9D25B|nr:B3 domain-containing transcription factor VRN1-like [Syzygium oleosum]